MPQHGSSLAQTVSSYSRISSDSPSASSTRMRLPRCPWFSPRMSTGIGDSTLLNRCHVEFTDVHEMPGDGCGGGHDRADEVRAAVFALAALEIAIAGAGAALVRRQDVGVHTDAHAATRVAPLKTGVAENFIESFFFGLRFNAARAGDNQCLLDVFCHMLAFDKMRGGAEIIEARIGAGADEDAVHGNIHDGCAGFQPHVFQRAFRGLLIVEILEVMRVR